MSMARNRIYNIVNRGVAIEPGSPEDDRLRNLLDIVERDAVHRAANDLFDRHMPAMLTHGPEVASGLALAIIRIDPYIKGEPTDTVISSCTEFCTGDEHWHLKEKENSK